MLIILLSLPWFVVVFVTGRNAVIKITNGAILRGFAPLIVAKFGTSEEINNPLRRAKFQADRSIYRDFWPKKTSKIPNFANLFAP